MNAPQQNAMTAQREYIEELEGTVRRLHEQLGAIVARFSPVVRAGEREQEIEAAVTEWNDAAEGAAAERDTVEVALAFEVQPLLEINFDPAPVVDLSSVSASPSHLLPQGEKGTPFGAVKVASYEQIQKELARRLAPRARRCFGPALPMGEPEAGRSALDKRRAAVVEEEVEDGCRRNAISLPRLRFMEVERPLAASPPEEPSALQIRLIKGFASAGQSAVFIAKQVDLPLRIVKAILKGD